ncbi:hypothetical protein [Stigmatella erecta]|uniref:Lipoprotein n=1 Tax=Stigmatella erecta TaxID=83460 RepID=A0A1I0IL99_9BACT|nr:hypothetical protein [Stigmatella erecta]SET97737.1 hypothetical protein SAMN05443639_106133 [Stigmatella erecta]
MKRVFWVLIAWGSLVGCGGSEDASWQDEQVLEDVQAAAISYMGCYVDTPALDEISMDRCTAAGRSPTVAVFRFYPPTPAAQVTWTGHPECTGIECLVPISPGQRITMQVKSYSYPGSVSFLNATATAVYHSDF